VPRKYQAVNLQKEIIKRVMFDKIKKSPEKARQETGLDNISQGN